MTTDPSASFEPHQRVGSDQRLLVEDGLVKAIYVVRNPDKLRHLATS
jgi:hypothetical protein